MTIASSFNSIQLNNILIKLVMYTKQKLLELLPKWFGRFTNVMLYELILSNAVRILYGELYQGSSV